MWVRFVDTKEAQLWPLVEYPKPPRKCCHLGLLQLKFPKFPEVHELRWMLDVWLWRSQPHVKRKRGMFLTEFAFSASVWGFLLWDSSVKHSLASIAKLLLASSLHPWWFLYKGLEKLLLQSVCSQHSLWNYFSTEIGNLNLSLLFLLV